MEEKPFTVRDRRINFDADDHTAESAAESAGKAAPPGAEAPVADRSEAPLASGDAVGTVDSATTATAPEGAGTDAPAMDGVPVGESESGIDFTNFAFSLAHAALIHMGLEAPPDGSPATVNRIAARQNIDILAMLEEKTRGNLSADEAEFIGKLLYTLRMSFVELSKNPTPD